MGNSNSSSKTAKTETPSPKQETKQEQQKEVLREFSIAGQKLKLDGAADVAEYVKQLGNVTGLEVVNLSGNTLGLEACRALATALEAHQTLQVKPNNFLFY